MMNCSKYHKQYYMPPVDCLLYTSDAADEL